MTTEQLDKLTDDERLKKRRYYSKYTGKKFGKLEVLDRVGTRRTKSGNIAFYNIKCDCGNIKVMNIYSVIYGRFKSCGCKERCNSHGMVGTPTYHTFKGMMTRCHNPNSTSYSLYGGRGIEVCKERRSSFKSFYEDMGDRPKGKTLDRIDPDRGYCKSNCRRATHKEQSLNTRGVMVYKGKTIRQWSVELGKNYNTIYSRIKRNGRSIKDALFNECK